jgi:hypothetical protein
MEVETQAAPSTAVMDSPPSGSSEYAEWRTTGNLPEPKVADPAPAAEDTKPAPADSGTAKPQEAPKPKTEKRFQQLLAERDQLKRDLEAARQTKPAESLPAKAPEVHAKPKMDDKGPDGKAKYGTYEDFTEALADWKAGERIKQFQLEQQTASLRQTVGQKIAEARNRYQDYAEVAGPVVADLMDEKNPISREVFGVINDSPVLADLLYVIGGSEETKADFLESCRSNPSKALRVALLMEQEIVAELGKKADRQENGQFKAKPEEPPAKKSPEAAPAPPIEINHRGGGTMDESAKLISKMERGEELSASESRSLLAAENRKALARRRGA